MQFSGFPRKPAERSNHTSLKDHVTARLRDIEMGQRTVEYCPGNSTALASDFTRFREGITTHGPNVP
jgi:hypothetical protein